MSSKSELKKLSEESLLQPPEKVFDIICKLGEGSYGSVYKALHKESSSVVAIKLVPVESDLHEIIKEISIMQQCDSPYVVRYYGSYFKQYDLWICMEYCGAGSVSDIMRLRKKTLNEDEISTILNDTLKGLEYLHLRRKIHRDIKAGNILLNTEGHAKLADFGVAGQLTDTMAKRNTLIGTPFWMAPEVIEEIGYNCVADIWSLGITALEMAEGKPPYGDIHPMRAIFMIPQKPPPSFREPDRWSTEFIDFVSLCLVKNPEERATASGLLEHDFIRNSKARSILNHIIAEACEIREHQRINRQSINNINQAKSILYQQQNQEDINNIDSNKPSDILNDSGTLVPEAMQDRTMISNVDCGTLIPDNATMIELESNLGTMVINSDSEDSTLKNLDPNKERSKYRPSFLDHFDKKKIEEVDVGAITNMNNKLEAEGADQKNKIEVANHNAQNAANLYPNLQQQQLEQQQLQHQQQYQQQMQHQQQFQQQYQMQQQQIQQQQQILQQQQYPVKPTAPTETMGQYQNQMNNVENVNNQQAAGPVASPSVSDANDHKYEFRNIIDGEFEFLKFLSFDDLQQKLANIDYEMEKEIDDLNKTYQAKRQPIIDAIDAKRKRQQNINNNLIKI